MTDTLSTQAALFDFVEQWSEDARNGSQQALSVYLARFPGHEEAVAREYLRLSGELHAPLPIRRPATGRASLEELIRRLETPRRGVERYQPDVELARGGMGAIVRVHDSDLDRDVAMKVMLGRGPRQVARFLEEAQVTGQLEHPGIVPVHELGVDGDGRVFFTMRLVEGRDLAEIIRIAHERPDAWSPKRGWSLARTLEVLLKVCDTVAYAHARGIVHRDLKPSNVRVGSFGEVYVMDWGLALVMESAARTTSSTSASSSSTPSTPSAPSAPSTPSTPSSSSTPNSSSTPSTPGTPSAPSTPSAGDSPLHTREGDVLGTPSYMSPEQAEGRTRDVGPASDVYAVGAMLYQVLSGSPPFVEARESPSSDVVLGRVRRGPPKPLAASQPNAPEELVAICERAMARDAGHRYAGLREMAEDLRAFLDGRVVRAHRTGAWAELAKWMGRNRRLAASLAGAVALAFGLVVSIAVLGARNHARLQLLADAHAPADLLRRAQEIVPSGPEEIAPLERWLIDARDLISRRTDYIRELEDLRAHSLPFDAASLPEREARREREQRIDYCRRVIDLYRHELAQMQLHGGRSTELMTQAELTSRLDSFEKNVARLSSDPIERRAWTFADPEDQLRFDTLEALVPETAAFLDSVNSDGWITRIQRRLDLARDVKQQTIVEAQSSWEQAIASIRDDVDCPLYHNLVLQPQLGLIPLRRDPRSGLWEFLHIESGSAPVLGADDRWLLAPESGIVLVLVPGGYGKLGAQRFDPKAPHFDPAAMGEESARIEGTKKAVPYYLEPYFISKYEITQAQWRRLAGSDSSRFRPETDPVNVCSSLHPAESMCWRDAMQVLSEVGLTLPTEAQWEHAARGGTETPWWTGAVSESMRNEANFIDARSLALGLAIPTDAADWAGYDDGFAVHAPVGCYRPNPYGLFDVCGNVAEWCRDRGEVSYDLWVEVRFGTFERVRGDEGLRVYRGGGFLSHVNRLRSASREFGGLSYSSAEIGLRPARELDH